MTPGDQPAVYRIRVGAYIDEGRADALGGLSISHEPDGTTTLIGPVADQAALYGIILNLRDMGLELLDVDRVESGAEASGGSQLKERDGPEGATG